MMTNIIIAALFLMNIVLMALISFDVLKRKSTSAEATISDKTVETEKSDSVPHKKAGIGKSKFSVEDVRKIATQAATDAVEKCIGSDMEDVEFEEPASENCATLDLESAKKAFETDDRLADEIANSDESVAQPMAGGEFFDELARTEVILGSKKEPTAEESQYVVRVFGTFRNTQLMAKLPQHIKDKLNECHRKVAEMMNSIPESDDSAQPVVIKTFSEFAIRDILPTNKKIKPNKDNENLYFQ